MELDVELFDESLVEDRDLEEKFIDFILNYSAPDAEGMPFFPYLRILESITETENASIVISYSDLVVHKPELAKLLLENPREVIKLMNRAIRRVIKKLHPSISDKFVRRFRVRIKDLGMEIPIRSIFRGDKIGKLVEFRALIVRATQVKQFLRRAQYQCEVCGTVFIHETEEFYVKPRMCPNPSCGNTSPNKFRLLPTGKEFEEYQELLVQEMPEELPAGKLPESCIVIVYGDLVDKVRPGDRIKITGIVLTEPERKLIEGRRPVFRTYVEAVYIEKPETEEKQGHK